MKLKSYFSGTVEAAMELARQELGDEALLVNARPASAETRYLGAYEVVFGLPPRTIHSPAPPAVTAVCSTGAPVPLRATPPPGMPANVQAAAPSNDRLAREVTHLKHEFDRMLRSLGAQDPAIAAPIENAAAPTSHCEVDATLGRPESGRAIVALVGPPGVGKTTTLIKLAARYGLAAHKPAQILSTDVYRIAAADQLRSLASILGIGCDVAETAGALAQLLEEHRSKELIFVDTPGLSPADMEEATDLARYIASNAQIDTHLVLPAFMRPSDLGRTIERFSVFAPHKLLFTSIDESGFHAELATEARRHAIPVSFLGTGQQIPDDLEPATQARIEELRGVSESWGRLAKGAAA